jgi:hypothetical protein
MADDEKDTKGDSPCAEGDSLQLGPDLGGVRPFLRHRADHSIELGLAKVADPEQPIPEGSLQLKHRQGTVYDIKGTIESGSRKGPAKVVSEPYRRNWDNIFGNRTQVGQA